MNGMNRMRKTTCSVLCPFLLFTLHASLFTLSSACSLFDSTYLDQQRAEIARLKQEADQLRREADTLQQQRQKEDQERAACNRAFYAFDSARKAADNQEAIARYRVS